MSSSPISSVQFSHSVMSNSLWPHELQHARLPCPSPTPGVHSNSCPLSQWCHPAISSSVIPFSSCSQSLSASESFPLSQLFTWDGQSIWYQIDPDTRETVTDFYFCSSKITVHGNWSHEVKRHLLLGGKAMTNLDSICNQRHHISGKAPYNQGMLLPSSHAWMWDLNHKEGWMPSNWCFRTVVLQKTLESLELQRAQTSQS